MNLLESTWFIVAVLLIAIVLLIDPKSSITGSNNTPILGAFSSPSSGQRFIYQFSAILIALFFVLTVLTYGS